MGKLLFLSDYKAKQPGQAKSSEEAFNEGKRAKESGLNLTDNPYSNHPIRALTISWQYGFENTKLRWMTIDDHD